MKNSTAKYSDLCGSLFGEVALAPYRAALKCASMANLGATATIKMNRALVDAYRESVRRRQDAFSTMSTNMINRLSHNGGSPYETIGALSQSFADIYRSATEGAVEFERAMATVREQCFDGLREEAERSGIAPVEVTDKKAA